MTTTNYFDTFIAVADDCPVSTAEIPPHSPDKPSVASMQYEMLINDPYKYTSDDVLSTIYAKRNDLQNNEEQRRVFFSKGQPCFRSSPLTKRYGWGVHSDTAGKIAIYPVASKQYSVFVNDTKLKQLKAMRSKRLKE